MSEPTYCNACKTQVFEKSLVDHIKTDCPGKDMRYKCPKCEMTSAKGQEFHESSECKFSASNLEATKDAFASAVRKPNAIASKSKKGKINIGLRSSKQPATLTESGHLEQQETDGKYIFNDDLDNLNKQFHEYISKRKLSRESHSEASEKQYSDKAGTKTHKSNESDFGTPEQSVLQTERVEYSEGKKQENSNIENNTNDDKIDEQLEDMIQSNDKEKSSIETVKKDSHSIKVDKTQSEKYINMKSEIQLNDKYIKQIQTLSNVDNTKDLQTQILKIFKLIENISTINNMSVSELRTIKEENANLIQIIEQNENQLSKKDEELSEIELKYEEIQLQFEQQKTEEKILNQDTKSIQLNKLTNENQNKNHLTDNYQEQIQKISENSKMKNIIDQNQRIIKSQNDLKIKNKSKINQMIDSSDNQLNDVIEKQNVQIKQISEEYEEIVYELTNNIEKLNQYQQESNESTKFYLKRLNMLKNDKVHVSEDLMTNIDNLQDLILKTSSIDNINIIDQLTQIKHEPNDQTIFNINQDTSKPFDEDYQSENYDLTPMTNIKLILNDVNLFSDQVDSLHQQYEQSTSKFLSSALNLENVKSEKLEIETEQNKAKHLIELNSIKQLKFKEIKENEIENLTISLNNLKSDIKNQNIKNEQLNNDITENSNLFKKQVANSLHQARELNLLKNEYSKINNYFEKLKYEYSIEQIKQIEKTNLELIDNDKQNNRNIEQTDNKFLYEMISSSNNFNNNNIQLENDKLRSDLLDKSNQLNNLHKEKKKVQKDNKQFKIQQNEIHKFLNDLYEFTSKDNSKSFIDNEQNLDIDFNKAFEDICKIISKIKRCYEKECEKSEVLRLNESDTVKHYKDEISKFKNEIETKNDEFNALKREIELNITYGKKIQKENYELKEKIIQFKEFSQIQTKLNSNKNISRNNNTSVNYDGVIKLYNHCKQQIQKITTIENKLSNKFDDLNKRLLSINDKVLNVKQMYEIQKEMNCIDDLNDNIETTTPINQETPIVDLDKLYKIENEDDSSINDNLNKILILEKNYEFVKLNYDKLNGKFSDLIENNEKVMWVIKNFQDIKTKASSYIEMIKEEKERISKTKKESSSMLSFFK